MKIKSSNRKFSHALEVAKDAFQESASSVINKGVVKSDYFAHKSKLADKALVFATLSSVLTLVVIVLLLALYTLSKQKNAQIPYVVEVNREGDVRFIENAAQDLASWTPSQTTMLKFASDYIVALRSVSIDKEVNKKNINQTYARSTHSAIKKIEDFYKEFNPLEICDFKKVNVEVYSAIPLIKSAATSFEIDWNERVISSSTGKVEKETNYRAIIEIKRYETGNLNWQKNNPLGLYVEDFEISQIKNGWAKNED